MTGDTEGRGPTHVSTGSKRRIPPPGTNTEGKEERLKRILGVAMATFATAREIACSCAGLALGAGRRGLPDVRPPDETEDMAGDLRRRRRLHVKMVVPVDRRAR